MSTLKLGSENRVLVPNRKEKGPKVQSKLKYLLITGFLQEVILTKAITRAKLTRH